MLLCVILMLREQKDASIGEDHTPETHIVPIILQVALGQRAELSILGMIMIHQMARAFEIMFTLKT